jgi:PAS domain S-box-containing protein
VKRSQPGKLRSLVGSASSLRGRLTIIILVTIAGALLTMTVALLYRDLSDYRESLTADLHSEAGIMALLAGNAIAFDDQPVAARNISALSEKAAVRSAGLYLADGSLYASYVREGALPPPAQLADLSPGVQVGGNTARVVRQIRQNDELLGVVYLVATYDVWARVNAYLGILGTILLVSMGVALLLAASLRRTIIAPVEELAAVADDIVTRRDPGRRAPDIPVEEFSVVARAFNSVLDESEDRTRALRQSERLYRAIGESIDYGVWVSDAEGRNVYASDSFLRLLGITQIQCSDMGWCDMLHPDDVEATAAAWRDCVRDGDFWYREHRFRGADGAYHPVLAQGVPMRDDEGRVSGWAGINLDISRMKKTEDALRETDRRKDDFLATLAHELRNPLAPIRHAAKLLGLKGMGPDQSEAARDIISRQVARMALLLDDLLEVSRITRGRLELRKARTTLADLVKAAVETSKPLIDAKGHEFVVDVPDVAVEMEVDSLRLSQALSNLLTNAAKYTDPGGRVELKAQCVADEVVFTVKDTGIGVPATALPTIFEMFSQVDSAIDRSEGGLGIGLALVKGLVLLHGGTVEASSDGPGRGSTFTLRLPAECVRQSSQEASALTTAAPERGQAGRILVVDDNRDAASSLAMVLQLAGHAVQIAHAGEEALTLGSGMEPDVVLLDIGLPDINGYDVARRIRRSAWGKGALLVALTGWGQKEDVERAHGAGFDLHLTKPADPERIEQLVEEFLAARRNRCEDPAPMEK